MLLTNYRTLCQPMELKLDNDLWQKLLDTKALRVPEEGNPRSQARELWAGHRDGTGSRRAKPPHTPGSPTPQSNSLEACLTCQAPQQDAGVPGQGSAAAAVGRVAAGLQPAPSIDRRHASELSYSQFVRYYMEPILPVIIEGAAEGWRARREWVRPDGSLDLEFLEANFGGAKVSAVDTHRRHAGSGPCRDMTLGEFIAWWREHSAAAAAAGEEGPAGGQLLYVKDWHFRKEFPEYKAYSCPIYFCDDWLNEWYDQRRERLEAQHTQRAQQAEREEQEQGALDGAGGHSRGGDDAASDYRFVYVGPKGTWTPLHSDVLRSHSWSTNVSGRKRWRLLHPRHTRLLYDRFGRGIAPDFNLGEIEGCENEHSEEMYPWLAEARKLSIEFVQEAGESVFVPSGWHHSVENIEDSISINHNWINGHNIHWVWHLVAREYREAEEGIEDCRAITSPFEFEGLVQRNLDMNAGLDFASLGDFLRSTAQRSMHHLEACRRLQAEHVQQAGQRVQQQQPVGKESNGRCCCCQPGAGSAGACQGTGSAAWGSMDAGQHSSEALLQISLSHLHSQTLPPCCMHHVLRLHRAGLALAQLLAAQQRIAASCRQAQTQWLASQQQQRAAEQEEGDSVGDEGVRQGVQDEGMPHEKQILQNQQCLACTACALQGLGLGRLAAWGHADSAH